ncbi:MAG: LptF/LptG family permease [Bacteroidales bacterium]|jgi:lipopolysaccharide export system permease protein|nr:LptF/LptG family permease [Bacteroidales bacterium]
MKLIDWYIFKKFIGTFFYAISLLIIIVIIFDISENIEDFLKNQAPVKEIIIDYYINFIPYFINLFVYLFTFISVIFFTSKMAGNTEIIAILSSGVSFMRMLRPYFLASLLLGIFSFYLGNFLIPQTNVTRRAFKDRYMEDLSKDKERNIHLQIEKGVFVFVENYNVKQQIAYRFTLEHFDNEKMTYKLIADRIELDTTRGPNAWKIINYTKRYIDGMNERIEKGITLDTLLNLIPTDLYKIKEDFEVMNFWELKEHINKERLKGSPGVVNYEVEMQKRLASPAAILILTFIGAALSSRKVRGGIGMHLGLGIAITFSYILFMQFSTVFATFGNLSPVWAAWIPNLLYAIMGVYLIIKAPK